VDVQRHPFFRAIKWPALLAKQLPPPYVPHVAGPLDVSHIDKRYTDDEAARGGPHTPHRVNTTMKLFHSCLSIQNLESP
jgi:hypothetical protein